MQRLMKSHNYTRSFEVLVLRRNCFFLSHFMKIIAEACLSEPQNISRRLSIGKDTRYVIFVLKDWTKLKQISSMKNKTRTSKVDTISKAQKTQNFFEKNLKFLNFFLSENVA